MAKKSRIEELAGRLAELETQRKAEANRPVAPSLDDQIEQAQAALKAAQAEADRAAAEALWPQEKEQVDRIVYLVAELRAELDALGETQAAIRRYHCMPKGILPAALYQALKAAEVAWRLFGTCGEGGTLAHPPPDPPRQAVKLPPERVGETARYRLPSCDRS